MYEWVCHDFSSEDFVGLLAWRILHWATLHWLYGSVFYFCLIYIKKRVGSSVKEFISASNLALICSRAASLLRPTCCSYALARCLAKSARTIPQASGFFRTPTRIATCCSPWATHIRAISIAFGSLAAVLGNGSSIFAAFIFACSRWQIYCRKTSADRRSRFCSLTGTTVCSIRRATSE